MTDKSRRHKATQEQKIQWLVDHKDEWLDSKLEESDLYGRPALGMKSDGLLSMRTANIDVRMDNLIAEAKSRLGSNDENPS